MYRAIDFLLVSKHGCQELMADDISLSNISLGSLKCLFSEGSDQ